VSTPTRPVLPSEARRKLDTDTLLQLIVSEAFEIKPTAIVHLDLRKLCAFTDHFLIVSVPSTRQVRAIAERIEKRLREEYVRIFHREEDLQARWILLDYSDVIIHIFDDEMRLHYDLEGLWADAPRREWVQSSGSVPLG